MIANSFDIFFPHPPHAATNLSTLCTFNFGMANPWERSHTLHLLILSPTTTHCFWVWLECMSFAHRVCNLFNIFPRASKYPDPEDVHTFGGSEYFFEQIIQFYLYVFYVPAGRGHQLVVGFT
jgi:hypothetical protein